MKKQTETLKLTFLAAVVAVVSIGCASTGYARYDDDRDAMGASAGAEVGGAGVNVDAQADLDAGDGLDQYDADTRYTTRDDRTIRQDRMDTGVELAPEEGSSRSTVSALSFAPETRPTWVNKFPFYDWNMAVIQTYTFSVPDDGLMTASSLPQFRDDLEPGAVFVEAAGGTGTTGGRVIQHSPNPVR